MENIIKKARYDAGMSAVRFVCIAEVISIIFVLSVVRYLTGEFGIKNFVYSYTIWIAICIICIFLFPVLAYCILRNWEKLQIYQIKRRIKTSKRKARHYRKRMQVFLADAFLIDTFQSLSDLYDTFEEVTDKEKELMRLEIEKHEVETEKFFDVMDEKEIELETKVFFSDQCEELCRHLNKTYQRFFVKHENQRHVLKNTFELIVEDLIDAKRGIAENVREWYEKKAQAYEKETKTLSEVLRTHYGLESEFQIACE